MSEIKRGLDIAPQTLYSATKRLKELNLVFEKTEKGFPRKVYLNLTRQGAELAKSLTQANEIVSETIEGFEKRLATLKKGEKTIAAKVEMIDTLYRLSELSYAQGRWVEAIVHSKECESLSKELKDFRNEAKSNWILAEIYRRRGEIQTAVERLQRSSELFTKLEDKESLSSIHYSFGAMSEEGGDFDKAHSEYQESQKLADEAGHEISFAKAMVGVGRILGKRGQYEESYRELMKAVRILENNNAIEELPIAYANLGATAFYVDTDEAVE